jgi:hypothetical protein
MPGGLQELIHKFEVGEGTRYVKVGALLLASLALAVVYNVREYKNFATPEAMDAAQVARNLAKGHGFSTKFIRPLSLYLVEKRLKQKLTTLPASAPKEQREALLNVLALKAPHPDLANAPLYPLVLAGLMKVLPFQFEIPRIQERGFERFQPEVLIGLFNQALFFVCLVMAFFLARRLFDATVAWVSVAILAGSDLLWRFSVSGLSTLLLLVIFLAVIECLVRLERGVREAQHGAGWLTGWAVAAGLCVGLGALTRYAFGWMILPVLAFLAIYSGPQRARLVLAAGLAFILVIAPWLVRNYNAGGTLLGTAGYALSQDTEDAFPESALERSLGPDLQLETDLTETKLDRVDLREYTRKLLVNLNHIVQVDLPRLSGGWLAAFFVTGLLVPFNSPALTRLRWLVVGSLALLCIVQALGRTWLSATSPEVNSENLLVLLAPLVVMYGVGFFFILLDQTPFPVPEMRSLVTVAFVSLACAPMIFTLLPPRSYPLVMPYNPPLIQFVTGWVKPEERLMTDMPWATAWYGDRSSIWLTMNPEQDFLAINDYQAPIHALYLTQITLDRRLQTQMLKGFDRSWGRFFLQIALTKPPEVPSRFPLKYAFTELLPEGHLLLTDRPRWKTAPK